MRSNERTARTDVARSGVFVLALLALGVGCRSGNRRALIAGPETIGANASPAQPYVVRMSDGTRDWEVEFPESTAGYEVRVPLRNGGVAVAGIEDLPAPMTDADRELLAELRRSEPSMEREGVFRAGHSAITDGEGEVADAGTQAETEADPSAPAPSRPSYLMGLNEVRRLYRSGNPEVAMVRLGRLLRAYPDDPRLLAMKGTLWLRLGRPELARRAWEEVLQREPDNRAVRDALQRLNEREDSGSSDDDDTSLPTPF